MPCLLRMLRGAILGALFGLAVGIGVGGTVAILCSLAEDPMDRWYLGVRVFVLLVGSGIVVGLVVGLASKVPEHGLPLLQSTAIVAIGGVVGSVVASVLAAGETDRFLLAPLLGVIIGGIVVVMVGVAETNAIRSAKQDGESSVNKT